MSGICSDSGETRRKINFMSGYTFEHESCDINDEVDAEIEGKIPELFADVIIRIGTFAESFVVHFWFFGRSRHWWVIMKIMFKWMLVNDIVVRKVRAIAVTRSLVVIGKIGRFWSIFIFVR